MRIWEIDLTLEGKLFEDSKGTKWFVNENEGLSRGTPMKYIDQQIEDNYTLKQLFDLTFTEVIDWSKVAVDTPVWVWNYIQKDCLKRHFSHVENDIYACFKTGFTSHTIDENIKNKFGLWNHCSLTDPNKGE